MDKLRILLMALCFCTICSCSNKTGDPTVSDDAGTEFVKEFYDCGIAMNDRVDDIFLLASDKVYFSREENGVDGKTYLRYYYGNVFSNEFFQETGVSIEYKYSVANIAYHDPNSNKDLICIVDHNEQEMVVLKRYTDQGDIVDIRSFPEEKINGEHISAVQINGVGTVFLLTHDGVYQFSNDEEIRKFEGIKGAQFLSLFLVDQKACCVTAEKNMQGDTVRKVVLYNEDGEIDKSMEVPAQSSLFSCQGEILFYNNKCIFELDKEFDGYEKILDFSEEESFSKEEIAIVKSNGKYGIFYKSLADGAYRTVLFDTEKTTSKRRTEITIYDPTGLMEFDCPDSLIDSFNEINQTYHVSVKEYERDLNYVLLSEDKPDLVFLPDTMIKSIGKEGYLENLTPYLDEDKTGFREEIMGDLFSKIIYKDQLYAIPRMIEFRTLCGYESMVGNKAGWTVEEFLNWLEDHPDALTESWMGHFHLLEFCLEGSLEQFVDPKARKAHFDDGMFGEMLKKIKSVSVNQNIGMLISAESGDIKCMSFRGLGDFFARRNPYDPLKCKGFPTENGSEKHLLEFNALTMFSQSGNKEGAFEFIKYFVRYRYGTSTGFHTEQDIFEKITDINGRQFYPVGGGNKEYAAIGEVEVDWFWELYEKAEVADIDQVTIMNMILADANGYFSDQKSLDDVIDVIQSKVQLLLNEQ